MPTHHDGVTARFRDIPVRHVLCGVPIRRGQVPLQARHQVRRSVRQSSTCRVTRYSLFKTSLPSISTGKETKLPNPFLPFQKLYFW